MLLTRDKASCDHADGHVCTACRRWKSGREPPPQASENDLIETPPGGVATADELFEPLVVEYADEDDLIGDDPTDWTPREVRRHEFKILCKNLEKLARTLPQLPVEDQAAAQKLFDEAERVGCELNLAAFYRSCWPYLDTAPYKHNWHIDATAAQAEKLITGETRRLIVNQPPRTGKSNLLSVVLPLWIWIQSEKGPLSGPQVKFLCASYGQSLSLKHSGDMRKIMESAWFLKHWGHRFKMREDRNAVGFFENTAGGYRISTSVGAGLTGQGGDFIIIDDPHNTQDVVSEAERTAAINWYTQSLSTRLNDPMTGAMLLVMQRQHEDDLTGYLMANEVEMWESFVLRMRYESNPFLEYDPRGYDEDGELLEDLTIAEGMLLWPARVPENEVKKLEKTLGTYGTAGQLQQRPQPKGGGILKEEFWGLYPPKGTEDRWIRDGKLVWPNVEYIIASLDGAYTEKEENDPSALTIWGVWYDDAGLPRIIAMHAWEDFLTINKLVMRVGNNCRKFDIDVLIIEDKASGHSAAQEIVRLFGGAEWTTMLVPVRGDKVARAISVQGIFEEGIVMAPDTEWAQLLIERCAQFPKGKRKDLVDSTTQAIRWLRDNGLIQNKMERQAAIQAALPRPGETLDEAPPYDC